MSSVLIFCGSSATVSSRYTEAAYAIGGAIARRGWGVVYGGHHAGLMGAVANGCRDHGGHVTGVLPDVLQGKEHPPDGIELVRVKDMHERKRVMVERSDVIIALPGGFGTFDELFEQLTWRMIGVHDKPVGVLDVERDGRSYWQPLWTFIDHAVAEGFVRKEARAIPRLESDIATLLDALGVS